MLLLICIMNCCKINHLVIISRVCLSLVDSVFSVWFQTLKVPWQLICFQIEPTRSVREQLYNLKFMFVVHFPTDFKLWKIS